MQKVEHEFRGKITLKNLIMMGEKKSFKFGKYSMQGQENLKTSPKSCNSNAEHWSMWVLAKS